MKKTYLIFPKLLFIFIFLLPSTSNALVCQNKVALAYGNGMFNTREDAEESRQLLENVVRNKAPIIPTWQYLAYAKIPLPILENLDMSYLAYASGKDGLDSTFNSQLLEVFYQKQTGIMTSFWR